MGGQRIPADRGNLRGAAFFARGHHRVQAGVSGRSGDLHASVGRLLPAAFAEHIGPCARVSRRGCGVHLERVRGGDALHLSSRAARPRHRTGRLRGLQRGGGRTERGFGNSESSHVALAIRHQHSVRAARAEHVRKMARAGKRLAASLGCLECATERHHRDPSDQRHRRHRQQDKASPSSPANSPPRFCSALRWSGGRVICRFPCWPSTCSSGRFLLCL